MGRTALRRQASNPVATAPWQLAVRSLLVGLLVLAGCVVAEGDMSGPPAQVVASTPTPAVSGGEPSPSSTPELPARTPSATCINPPTGVLDLVYQSDPLACYGGEDLTVEGYVQGLGAVECGPLAPAWFACERIVELRPLETAVARGIVLVARSTQPLLTAVLHPSLGLYPYELTGDPQRITGHYDDPAAVTCHYTDAEGAASESPEATVLGCRSTFVIIALDPIGP